MTGLRRSALERLGRYELVESPPYAVRILGAWHSDWGDFGRELDAIAGTLPPAGVLAFEVLVPELLDETTLDWFHGQQRAIAAASDWPDPPRTKKESRAWLDVWYRTVPPVGALRERLEPSFVELAAARAPVLHKHLGPAAPALEQGLVDAGAIRAVGFRYAGARRTDA